jgi:hypothetical protein
MSRRGKRKIHTLEIGEHVQMAKSGPEAQRKSSLSDCTWLENEYGSFDLEALKFLMHCGEPGEFTYFIFTHTHIFLYLFSFFLFLIFSFSKFYLLPLNSKIAMYLRHPPCLDVARPRAKR